MTPPRTFRLNDLIYKTIFKSAKKRKKLGSIKKGEGTEYLIYLIEQDKKRIEEELNVKI